MKKQFFLLLACMTAACFGLQAKETKCEDDLLLNEEMSSPQLETDLPLAEKFFESGKEHDLRCLTGNYDQACSDCDRGREMRAPV